MRRRATSGASAHAVRLAETLERVLARLAEKVRKLEELADVAHEVL
jgi:hypothetical protein